MLIADHVETAHDFLDASDREFGAGDVLQGSEKLWGAASHAVMAAAQQRGWPMGSHRQLKVAADKLAAESGDQSIRAGFALAEKFHANFYHGFMEDWEIRPDRDIVHEFVICLTNGGQASRQN